MRTLCFALRFLREFSTKRDVVKLNSDSFGSLYPSDVQIERLSWEKTHDFENAAPAMKVKELKVPLSLSKKKREQLVKFLTWEPPPTGHRCLIECSRPEFNLHDNQLGGVTTLCSQFWTKSKYNGHWFVIRRRTKVSSQFVKWENAWECYVPDRLHPLVANVLKDLGLKRPTYVQSQCLNVFASNYHLFIAAETGSGKTIAYAAPLITKLLYQKERGVSEKAVILAVTTSLRIQLAAVLAKLVSKTDLKVSTCSTKADFTDDWDILVGTPGLVEKYFRDSKNLFNVKHLILDEADMLLDESFTDVLTELFSFIPIVNSITNTGNTSTGARVIFSSASCPEQLECIADSVVDRQFLRYVKSPKLHFLLNNIEMKFMRVREKDKITILRELLIEDMARGDLNESMVFCKNRATASFVHHQLQSFPYEVSLWESLNNVSDGRTARIFVATDGTARGIDLPQLSHVINYDLASYNTDFLHRIGRVGRLSSAFLGRVTSFVRTKREVRLTNAVEQAARLGRPLTIIEPEYYGRKQMLGSDD